MMFPITLGGGAGHAPALTASLRPGDARTGRVDNGDVDVAFKVYARRPN